ncbi:MAG: MarR family transcriptional regulator [Rhodocyclaceae bacterium]|nr:MarR family transcriptional regulator [Rhodocyclaceae bacterium]MBX3670219.1 MarR family transcriptional regulator [Rhodocyclaceae bacterium]
MSVPVSDDADAGSPVPNDGSDAGQAFARLLLLVRTLQASMQNVDRVQGLSGSQLWALWLISAEPGLTVSALAHAMLVHHSSASNLLDKLESNGLVLRARQKEDCRVVRVHLTSRGESCVQSASPLLARLRAALQQMPPASLAGLRRGLGELLDIVDPGVAQRH